MGVWSSPFHDVEVARELQGILESSTPVPPIAGQEFYEIVGDDGFFNLVTDTIEEDPEFDMRHYAAEWIANWLKAGEATWTKPWNPEAVAIATDAVTKFQKANPLEGRLPAEYQSSYFPQPRSPRP